MTFSNAFLNGYDPEFPAFSLWNRSERQAAFTAAVSVCGNYALTGSLIPDDQIQDWMIPTQWESPDGEILDVYVLWFVTKRNHLSGGFRPVARFDFDFDGATDDFLAREMPVQEPLFAFAS